MTSRQIELCRQVPLTIVLGMPVTNRKTKILCPFHAERTPSCILFPTGGYKCFACPAKGSSISFLMALSDKQDEKEKFKEAVEELTKYI